MTDFTQLMDPPPPTDWTDHGIFRAAFLAVFDPEDRTVLRQVGYGWRPRQRSEVHLQSQLDF